LIEKEAKKQEESHSAGGLHRKRENRLRRIKGVIAILVGLGFISWAIACFNCIPIFLILPLLLGISFIGMGVSLLKRWD
jgi:uncharacterized membrane protein HdeD (DUF308 family)